VKELVKKLAEDSKLKKLVETELIRYSRSIAWRRSLKVPTNFSCAELTSASVRLLSAFR